MAKKVTRQAKYRRRRTFILMLPLLMIVAIAGWLIWTNIGASNNGEDESQSEADVSSSSSAPESSSKVESSSQSESESESEPEPEPEPEPVAQTGDWTLILANSTSPLPDGYAPPELYTLSDGYKVDSRIAGAVNNMFIQALEDGISLMNCSAYRAVEKQTELFEAQKQRHMENGKSEDEAIAATASAIAYPGTSEHQTGLALDIVTPEYQTLNSGFENTAAFKWLDENAHLYGFVLRYPKDKQSITNIIYEPWHYRYVGVENAEIMKKNGYCLEEYVYVLSQEEQQRREQAEKESESEAESEQAAE